MSDFTRGNTFAADETVSPGNLNALVENATVTNISLSELGAAFKAIFYTDTDPGVTSARVWYDTTAGQAGLKYGFVSPSTASVAGWLYATPRREAYYWAATAVSVGSPLFVARADDVESEMAAHFFDGLALLKVYPAAGSTAATETSPALVIATESVTGGNPVKCAWAGLVPFNTADSNVSINSPLYVDNRAASVFTSEVDAESDITTSLAGYWHLDGASGATRPDSGPNGYHLLDNGSNVGEAAGNLNASVAQFDSGTDKLRNNDNAAEIDFAGGLDFSGSVWLYMTTKGGAGQFAVNKNWGPAWDLRWNSAVDAMMFSGFSTLGTVNYCQVIASEAPVLNTWFNVQWKVQHGLPGTASIRINGGAWAATQTSNSGIAANTGALAVGLSEGNTGAWPGRVEELALWKSRLLTDAEFDTIYNAGAGKLLASVRGNESISRSNIYGTTLQNRGNSPPLSVDNPIGVLWGTGPVIQDTTF